MVDESSITEDMQVLGSDGGLVGMVARIVGDRITLKREPAGDVLHIIPISWVVTVDAYVHLDRPAARVHDDWIAAPASSARPTVPQRRGATGSLILWAIGVLFLLIVLYLGILAFQYASGDRGDTRARLPPASGDAAGNGVGGN